MKLLILICATIVGVLADEDGFLPNSKCESAQDCYIFDDTSKGLQLACWYNVNKCKCQNTIRSDHHLLWKDGKCRMSKYGPCGKKGALEVDCLDGFQCIDNKCRDPKPGSEVMVGPYTFERSCTGRRRCDFGTDLDLECDRGSGKCICRKIYIADGRGTSWDLRSYDGDRKCSVGKFGPCGEEDGIKIECHAPGTTCVKGICLDPNHPVQEVNEPCEKTENCKSGLICSGERNCIEKKSLEDGKQCLNTEECKEGLTCGKRPGQSPWGSSICLSQAALNEPRQRI